MVSDDERRRVAERLRGEVGCGSSWPGMERLGVILGVEGGPGFPRRFLSRLADLIEPVRDMLYVTYSRSTCGPDGRAYMVKVRHRTRGWERDFYSVDREALLALADEMDERAPYGWYSGERDSLREYARRIREALGAQDA